MVTGDNEQALRDSHVASMWGAGSSWHASTHDAGPPSGDVPSDDIPSAHGVSFRPDDAEPTDTRETLEEMSRVFGVPLADVKLRTDIGAAERARGLGAAAYTEGNEVGFAPGEFQPKTPEGRHTIAHELSHVVQRRGGTPGAGASSTDVERVADDAASAVLDGRMPLVSAASVIGAARKPQDPADNAPPRGSYRVESSVGNVVITFNADDVRSWWGQATQVAFGLIVKEMYSGVTDAVVAACGRDVDVVPGTMWAKPADEKTRSVVFEADLQVAVVAWFKRHHPEIGRRPLRTSGGEAAPKRAPSSLGGAQARPEEPDPVVASPAAQHVEEVYGCLLRNFGGHVVFARDHATLEDLLVFHAAAPSAFAHLPSTSGAPKDRSAWESFLDRWYESLHRKGDPRGEPDGDEGGVPKFVPHARLDIAPALPAYVTGSELRAQVKFDEKDPDNAAMNIDTHRARVDWSLVDRATGKVIDSGPFMEAPGDIEWKPDLPSRPGRYFLRAVVTSPYFKKGSAPVLESDDLAVVTEAELGRRTFDQALVGKDKPFARGADGTLSASPGVQPRTLYDEVSATDAQLGGLRAMHEKGQLPEAEYSQYRAHFDQQRAGLSAWQEKLDEPGSRPYLVRGTFVSRETSTAIEIKAYMSGHVRPGRYEVQAVDTTLDLEQPNHHAGKAEIAEAGQSRAELEKQAIHNMASDWGVYNDYPPGKIRLAIQLHESPEVLELTPIETTSTRKTAKNVLKGFATLGGLALLAASPFTGGSTAAAGLVILTSVAGVGATILEIQERAAREGGLKIDGRLALDVASIASNALGLGGMSRGLQGLSAGARTMYYGAALGLDAAQGFLLASEVHEEIIAIDAQYTLKINQAGTDEEKQKLQRERDSLVAELVGHAALSGLFLVVSAGHNARAAGGAWQSGIKYHVSEEIEAIARRGDEAEIRQALKSRPISFHERAYLQEVLSSPKAGEASQGKEAPRVEVVEDHMPRTAEHAGGEFHNHLMGVPGVDYFVSKAGDGSVFVLFDRCYAILAQDKQLQAESPHAWRVAQKTKQDFAELDRQRAPIEEKMELLSRGLGKILAASDETPFNESYDLRDELVKRFIDPGGRAYRSYARGAMKQLAKDGVSYSEQSVSPKKLDERFPEEAMAQARKELQAEGIDTDVRFLAMMPTKLFGARAGGKDFHAFMDTMKKVLARGDVIGIDVAGPEVHLFTAEGRARFRDVYEAISAAAKARDRALVFRPHVGEGFAARDEQRHVTGDHAHEKLARQNIEALIETLEGIGYNAEKAQSDGVIVRFGHQAHATPEQIQRMAKMGVIAEANLGSNMETHSISKLEEHPLLYQLYYQQRTVLSTDGQGVMNTSMKDQVKDARQLIERFKAGEFPLVLDGQPRRFVELSPEEQLRFDVSHLLRWAAESGAMVKQGDSQDLARRTKYLPVPKVPPPHDDDDKYGPFAPYAR
jgi:hypothetical protein